MVHDRWVVEENWRRFKPIVLGGVPAPMRMIVAPMARRGVKAQLKGHGMGHHTQGEIHDIGRRDLSAIEAILGSKPFLLGDAPTGIDATAYGLLANILYPADIKSPLQDHIRAHPTLAGYVDRFRARFYA
jgi:glutathione S-transferase